MSNVRVFGMNISTEGLIEVDFARVECKCIVAFYQGGYHTLVSTCDEHRSCSDGRHYYLVSSQEMGQDQNGEHVLFTVLICKDCGDDNGIAQTEKEITEDPSYYRHWTCNQGAHMWRLDRETCLYCSATRPI